MYKNKSFLAIIPARSGSKGLVNKNIKEINKIPLMAYTILNSICTNIFDDIVVSTDSEKYAQIARNYGASVPFLRPDYLATDTATTYDLITYTLNELEKLKKTYDYFVLLQPTSPLRDDKDIINAVDLLIDKNANAVVSVCEVNHPSYLNVNLSEDKKLDGFSNIKRHQDVKIEYKINGAIYICSMPYFFEFSDFYKENCFAFVMDKFKSIDIDDIYDFMFAQTILNLNYKL